MAAAGGNGGRCTIPAAELRRTPLRIGDVYVGLVGTYCPVAGIVRCGCVRPGEPISHVRAGLADLRNLFAAVACFAAVAAAVGDTAPQPLVEDNCEGLSSQSETRPDGVVPPPPPLLVGVFPFVISLSESLLCIL